MATSAVSLRSSSTSRTARYGSGSVKSLAGISIFQDPEAGSTLPRDEEMTFMMYEGEMAGGKVLPGRSVSQVASQRSSRAVNGFENGNVINGDLNARTNDTDSYTFTFSHSETGVKDEIKETEPPSQAVDVEAHSNAAFSSLERKELTDKLLKSGQGSFQIKSAFGVTQLSRASSVSSNHTLKDGAFKSTLDDTLTRKLKKDKSPSQHKDSSPLEGRSLEMINTDNGEQVKNTSETSGQSNGYTSGDHLHQSSQYSSSKEENYDFHHQGQSSDMELSQTTSGRPESSKRDSDLTSVSSLTSYSLGDSLQRNAGKESGSRLPDSPSASDAGSMTPKQAVSRSESQRSVTRSLSKSPSLSNIQETKTLTEVYSETDRDKGGFLFKSSQSDNLGGLDRQSSSVSSGSSKMSTVIMSKNIEKSSTASSNKSLPIPKVSSQSSIVQNKEFREKMSSLFSSSGASLHRSDSPSMNSSASSTMARGHEKTYRNDLHLEVSSHTTKQSEKVLVRPANSDIHSATFPRASHDDNRPISPEPVSRAYEMQSTIKTGTVGSLVKDKFKNLNLTGRSLDPSTLERDKSKPSAESLDISESSSSPGQKQYKFLIEGIDIPERETPEAENKNDQQAEVEQDGSPESSETSLSMEKKKELLKKGFSYVLDKQLASQIIKKAEDVTARRPHEAVEVKTSEETQKETEESEILVEAKSKLKHEESFSGSTTDYRAKQPLPVSLLKDIRSRLVPVQNGEPVEEQKSCKEVDTRDEERDVDTRYSTEPVKVEEDVLTPTKVERKDPFSTSLNESQLSSITTVASTQNTDVGETTMTSSQTVDGTEISSQEDLLPVSDKKLIYDGFNYELRHSGLLEGEDSPKSYSQVFTAKTKQAPSGYTESSVSRVIRTETPAVRDDQFKETSPQETVLLTKTKTGSRESFFQDGAKPVKVENMQKMHETVITQRDNVTGVKSLRQHTKEGGFNTESNDTSTIQISQYKQSSPISFQRHAIHSDTDSPASTPVKYPSSPSFGHVPKIVIENSSGAPDSSEDDSVLEQKISPAKRNGSPRIVSQESQQPRAGLLTRVPVEKKSMVYEQRRITHDTNKSFGTEVKETPLKKNNNRAASGQVRHNDLPDVYTKETHDFSGVTSDRKTTPRGQGDRGTERVGSELHIEVTGGNQRSGKQRGEGRLHISTTNKQETRELHHNSTQDLFYSDQPPQHLVTNSAPVYREGERSTQGQLYTTVHSVNTNKEPIERSPSGSKSPRGGVLYVRHRNNKYSTRGEQSSPHYSETTHTSTSSGAVSPPAFRQELFYQPPPARTNTTQRHVGRAVSRSSSSSAVGSVNSFRSEGVYVYRTDKKSQRRTLKELNDLKVVHLKPLQVKSHQDGQKVLRTHPTFYSPNDSVVTSPVYSSDIEQFDASNMMGTSTLRNNTDHGYAQMGRDKNMNYKGSNNSRRFLTVDEISGGRVPIHRGMQVSTINIDNNYNDTHSGVSEPVISKRNKYPVQRVMDTRRSDNQFTTPIDMHPDMAFKKQKFYSVTRNVEPKSPEVQVELDPHLEEAHKTGDQYNVTMKLNASSFGLPGNPSTNDMYQEEYIEESLYQNNNNNPVRSPPPQMISPGMYSSRSTSDDSAIVSPGNRSKTNITLIEDYASAQPVSDPATMEHMRFTQYMGNPPRIVSSATPATRNDNDPRPRKKQQMPVQQKGVDPSYQSNNVNNTAPQTQPPKFSMSIDQTMTMDYVPGSEQEINNNNSSIRPQRANIVESEYVPQEPTIQRRDVQQNYAVMDTQRMVNGDVYSYNGRPTNGPVQGEDLEQYLSLAEEEPITPTRVKPRESDIEYPQVVRGSILIKNAIDTTGAPKVIDVVEGDTESDDDTLIHDNVNPFHGHYFQARENPMYSSDPDLRAEREQQQKGKPGFTKVFEQVQKSSTSRNYNQGNGGLDYPENEDFDTEITVTRGE